MSIKSINELEVTVDTTKVVVDDPDTLVSTTSHEPCIQEQDTGIDVVKSEYSIVGDALFATVTGEVPYWLSVLIDNAVAASTAKGFTDYDLLVQDVRNAIDQLDVAANTYVEQIILDQTIDQAITARLTTLNATYENQFATKVELTTAVANSESALVQDITDLQANFNSTIDSRITTVETAYAAADATLTNSITALTTTFTDQAGDVSANASAISGLQTYIGVDENNSPIGSGLVSRVGSVEDQNDGVREIYYFNSYDNIVGAIDESSAISIYSSQWTTQELRDNANGSVIYFRDTTNAYQYRSSVDTWMPISDTSVYEALQGAEDAYILADGKVSQFYAWGSPTDLAPYDVIEDNVVLVKGNAFKYWFKSDGNLYYKPNTTWIINPNVDNGDILEVFNPIDRDYTVYTYNGSSWVRSSAEGYISKSKFFVDLENDVTGPTGHVAVSLSNLQQTSEAYADAEGARVESKFAYDSVVNINGQFHEAGFGLVSEGSGTGTELDPFDSSFWINAERFKFTNTNQTGQAVPFTIDASGATPQVTFNGKVSFDNIESGPSITRGAGVPTGNPADGSIHIRTDTTPDTVYVYDADNTVWTPAKDSDAIYAADLSETGTTVINGGRIATGTITASLLATNEAIITGTAQIGTGVIESANIGTAEVETLKIAGDAVTVPLISSNTGGIANPIPNDTWVTVTTITTNYGTDANAIPTNVLVTGNANFLANSTSGGLGVASRVRIRDSKSNSYAAGVSCTQGESDSNQVVAMAPGYTGSVTYYLDVRTEANLGTSDYRLGAWALTVVAAKR